MTGLAARVGNAIVGVTGRIGFALLRTGQFLIQSGQWIIQRLGSNVTAYMNQFRNIATTANNYRSVFAQTFPRLGQYLELRRPGANLPAYEVHHMVPQWLARGGLVPQWFCNNVSRLRLVPWEWHWQVQRFMEERIAAWLAANPGQGGTQAFLNFMENLIVQTDRHFARQFLEPWL